MSEPPAVTIYTDGACMGNPGPGGYGVILIQGSHREELSGGFRLTTNNRMELMAAIVGLQTLRTRCAVTLYSDSQYLVEGITQGWAQQWRASRWIKSRGKALNADLGATTRSVRPARGPVYLGAGPHRRSGKRPL